VPSLGWHYHHLRTYDYPNRTDKSHFWTWVFIYHARGKLRVLILVHHHRRTSTWGLRSMMQGSQQEVAIQTRCWTVSEIIAQLDQQQNYANEHIGKTATVKIDAYPVFLIFVPNCIPRLSFPAELQVMDGRNAVLHIRCPVPGHWLQLLALQPRKTNWVSISKQIVQKQHFGWHGTLLIPKGWSLD
jgi:hypothetical protein